MKNTRSLPLLFLAAAAALGSIQQSRAASATWNGTTDATWATDTNWSATPAPGTGNTATFNNAGNTNTTLDLGAGVTIGSILFGSSSVAAYTIGSGAVGAQTLTLDGNGTITANSTINANQLFNANLSLAGNATVTNSDTGSKVTFAGGISGSSAGAKTLTINSTTGGVDVSGAITNGSASSLALVKSGTGILNLTGANTYNGTTTIIGGNSATAKLLLSGTGALSGGGALQVGSGASPGRFEYTSSAVNTQFSTITVGGGSSGGTGTLVQSAGNITATTLRSAPGRTGGNTGNIDLSGGVLRVTGIATIGEQDLSPTPSTVTISGTGLFKVDTGLKVGIAQADTRDGNGIITQNGGTVIVGGGLTMAGTANAGSARTAIYNLNGGTLNVNVISMATSGNGTNTSTFNFAGGTLKPTGSNATFMQGLTTVNVKNGGAIIDTNGFNVTIAQPLVHFAGASTDTLTKNGAGNLTLTGNNTYTGATLVNAGTLIVSGGGVINTSSQVAVAGGATLTQNAAAALTAPLSLAGNSTISGSGDFTTTNLTIVGDLTGGTFSAINSPATFSPSGSLAFTLTNTTEGTYDLFTTNPASFSFTSVSVGALPLVDSGGTFSANDGLFSYTFVNGTDALQIVAIPEPGTWVLVGIGLTFLLYRKPRRFEA